MEIPHLPAVSTMQMREVLAGWCFVLGGGWAWRVGGSVMKSAVDCLGRVSLSRPAASGLKGARPLFSWWVCFWEQLIL